MAYNYNFPININIPNIPFRAAAPVYNPVGVPAADDFVSNPLINKTDIEAEIKSNPKIAEIMNEYNLPVKVNIKELEKLQHGHLRDTRVTAAKIYSSLPQDLKQQVNLPDVQTAAMYHDYGKILIPDKVLNKEGKLDDKEREIMNQHSELGYELLKNKGLSKNALNLIKYHHQKPDGGGYPAADSDFEYGLESEIVNAADKYTALREKRSYKDAMTHEEALAEIRKDVESGLISEDVYNALIKIV